MVADKDFQRMLTVERQRSERSRRAFLLLLMDKIDFARGLLSRENTSTE